MKVGSLSKLALLLVCLGTATTKAITYKVRLTDGTERYYRLEVSPSSRRK